MSKVDTVRKLVEAGYVKIAMPELRVVMSQKSDTGVVEKAISVVAKELGLSLREDPRDYTCAGPEYHNVSIGDFDFTVRWNTSIDLEVVLTDMEMDPWELFEKDRARL